ADRSSKQSDQAPARCRPASPSRSWVTKPKTDRRPLSNYSRCNARHLPSARVRRLTIDNFFAGLRPEAPIEGRLSVVALPAMADQRERFKSRGTLVDFCPKWSSAQSLPQKSRSSILDGKRLLSNPTPTVQR